MTSGGIIWITGYSSAGKSTVARVVQRRLAEADVQTIFLDGDDLRSILGGKWGYERADRIELARVYFHLCAHLASQGVTVVIAAVAMYDEVRTWLRETFPQAVQVYLRVSSEERQRRDQNRKNVYARLGQPVELLYDEPESPDLLIDNGPDTSPEAVATTIVEYYRARPEPTRRDVGRTAHWSSYYERATIPTAPSPFATYVGERVGSGLSVLEVGCGNGRDAAHFRQLGHRVTAIDLSERAIGKCVELFGSLGIRFVASDLAGLSMAEPFDVIYSRFCLHAMTLDEEQQTLAAMAERLVDGHLFLECRSINDPLARKGEVISPTERIFGHYRRFIVKEELAERLTAVGFSITSLVEAQGLAPFGDEDPVVIRVEARRRG